MKPTSRFKIPSHYLSAKRGIDIVVATFAILFFMPLLAVVTIASKLSSSGPVLFWSERVGLEGRIFKMPKFRSMSTCSKIISRENATTEDIKITPFGRFIRRTSIDELPQLWCVLKGDMSLIGPRPLLLDDQTTLLRQAYSKIYDVKPGITGLAQVNGRNFITRRNKTRYDFFYATRVCFILDLKIALSTIWVVLRQKNIT